MIKLKVSKEELLQWYADNDIMLMGGQIKDYINEDWDSFVENEDADMREKEMFKEYFEELEPEPNYNEWIGEDCVFSNYPIVKKSEIYLDVLRIIEGSEVYLGVLIFFDISLISGFRCNDNNNYLYCMLKKDYVKLLKEQSK
jgi:hypothetical protein